MALTTAGLTCQPQYVLNAGPLTAAYDLGLEWAKVLVDLQSKIHHSGWDVVVKDITRLHEVNLERGWKLVWSTPGMVWPRPARFVARVLETVVTQLGARSAYWRRRYARPEGGVDLPGSLAT